MNKYLIAALAVLTLATPAAAQQRDPFTLPPEESRWYGIKNAIRSAKDYAAVTINTTPALSKARDWVMNAITITPPVPRPNVVLTDDCKGEPWLKIGEFVDFVPNPDDRAEAISAYTKARHACPRAPAEVSEALTKLDSLAQSYQPNAQIADEAHRAIVSLQAGFTPRAD